MTLCLLSGPSGGSIQPHRKPEGRRQERRGEDLLCVFFSLIMHQPRKTSRLTQLASILRGCAVSFQRNSMDPNPQQSGIAWQEKAEEVKEGAKERAEDAAEGVQHAAGRTKETAEAAAERTRESAKEAAQHAKDKVYRGKERTEEMAQEAAERARGAVQTGKDKAQSAAEYAAERAKEEV